MKKKKILLFVGSIPASAIEALEDSKIFPKEKFQFRVLCNKKAHKKEYEDFVDFTNEQEIRDYFLKFSKNIFSVTARGEKNIPLYQKVIPFLPEHISAPSIQSLNNSTDKFLMRKTIEQKLPKLNPKFLLLKEYKEEDLDRIIRKISFPVIVKPTGLASSMLVSAAYHKDELRDNLKKIFKKIDKVHKDHKGRGSAKVLVEEYIEGDIFSTDIHVDSGGGIAYNPFVQYVTAAQKGVDDFYIYEQHCPANINKNSASEAKAVIEKVISTLELKNSSAHVELIRNEHEWKLIEIGPRLGGYRNTFYRRTFNIRLDENDLLIKTAKKVKLTRKKCGYISILKFTAREEGYLQKISGIQKLQKLESYDSHQQRSSKGDKILFAKHGGKEVLNVTLFNKDKQQFIADKRRLEKMLEIHTSKRKNII